MELFRILGTIAIDNKSAIKALEEISKKAGTTSNNMLKAYDKIGGGVTAVGKKLTNFVTKPALAAGTALAGITLGKGWSRMVQIDTAKAKLTGLGHSAKEVSRIMDNAIESVKGTAFGMDEAATTAASAVAAGIPVGKDLTRYLTLVGDAAAIAGTSMGEMGSIFNKVAANGKISAEEMNQLADRGIPVFQLLAETTGMSMAEVRDAVSSGQIGIEELQDAIEKGMGGAAKTIGSTTITGAISNIGASISRIGANFLGSSDDAKSFAGQLLPILNDVQKWLGTVEEKAKVMGEKFGQSFKNAVEVIKSIPAPVFAIGGAIAMLAGPLLQLTGKFITTQAAIGQFLIGENRMSIMAGIANGELTLQQAALIKVSDGLKSASGSVKKFISSTAISASTTVRDTAAKVVNAVATSKVGNAAKGAAVKVIAFANAHKVAMLAAFGLAAPIILLAGYMLKTGASAEETASMITAFSNKLAVMIIEFANNLPAMIDAILPAITNVIESLVSTLPVLIPVLIQAGIKLFMALVDSLNQIIPPLVAALPQIVQAVVNALPILIPALIQAGVTLFMALVEAIPLIVQALIDALPEIVRAVKEGLAEGLSAVWEYIKRKAAEKWQQIKEKITDPIEKARQKVNDKIDKIKSYFNFENIVEKVKRKFDSIKEKMFQPIEKAREKINSALKKIKGYFPLKVGKIFSGLKIPKITVDGGKAPFGIGGKGSLPKFHVNWNAKGAIFDQPTIFATPQGLQGVGEAGKEAVTPIDTLQKYVANAVASQNGELVAVLYEILDAIKTMDAGVFSKIETALDNRKIEWNNRELGRFVKTYA